jgi:hypothetical protein
VSLDSWKEEKSKGKARGSKRREEMMPILQHYKVHSEKEKKDNAVSFSVCMDPVNIAANRRVSEAELRINYRL